MQIKNQIQIENDYYVMQKRADMILIRFAKDLIYDLPVSSCVQKDISILAGKHEYRLMSDMSKIRYWTVGAKHFRTSLKSPLILAEAIMLPETYAARIWEAFFRRFHSPAHPLYFCKSEKEGIFWLRNC